MNPVHSQLGQILDKSWKKDLGKHPTATFKEPEQKKEVASKSRVLGMPPHMLPPKPLLWPVSAHTLILTPYKEQISPPPQEPATRSLLIVLTLPATPAATGARVKPA